jgi:hypothetical protein
MNTCQSSTQGFSASGVQGWVKRFLDTDVCAFIGAIWSVSDDTAFQFSQGLYLQLANRSALGDAVQKARIKCKESGDLSWLSYQVYGHPNMQIRLPVEADTT